MLYWYKSANTGAEVVYLSVLVQAPQFTRFTSTKVQILARLLHECALPAFGRVRARAAARMLTHAEAC